MEVFRHGVYFVHVVYGAIHRGTLTVFELDIVVIMYVSIRETCDVTEQRVTEMVRKELARHHPEQHDRNLGKGADQEIDLVHADIHRCQIVQADAVLIAPDFCVETLGASGSFLVRGVR